MPKIVVANVDGLAMSGTPRDDEDYRYSSAAAERLLVMVSEEDLIILPQRPSEAFLDYCNELYGRSISAKQVVVPARGREDGLIWSHEALNDGDVRDQVTARVGSVHGWDLVAFFLDRPVVQLADTLGLRLPASASFLRHGGAESLNSKVVFREIAATLGVPLAAGRVVAGVTELAEAMAALVEETGHVIVKQDLNLGGVGNTVVTRTDRTGFPGSRTTVRLGGSAADVVTAAGRLWPVIASGRNTRAVVETYYPDARPLCCEFFVHGPGRTPDLLNFGEMRMAPVFVGLELHSGGLGEVDSATMVAACLQVAAAAGDRGFHGYLNVDSLLTASGNLLVSEINGRMGGTTHIDVMCRQLLGAGYPRSHVVISRNRVPALSFPAARGALATAGLLFDHDRGEGVVFAADGVELTGSLEYVVLARDPDRARRLDARAADVLAGQATAGEADRG